MFLPVRIKHILTSTNRALAAKFWQFLDVFQSYKFEVEFWILMWYSIEDKTDMSLSVNNDNIDFL